MSTSTPRFSRRLLWIGGFVIFALAFLLRVFVWFRTPWHRDFNDYEVVQAAMCFARYGYLGNPFLLPTGPTAHVTPAFPFLIGLAYRYAPNWQTAQDWKNIITIATASLQFALLPFLARSSGLNWISGIFAGLIGAAVPMLFLDCSGDFEAPLVGLTVVASLIAALSLENRRSVKPRTNLLLGLMWGLTALVSAQLLLCGAVYEFVRQALSAVPIRRRVQGFAITAIGIVIGVLPWTIRNYVELGSPVISRDNAGIELYVSNNNETAVDFVGNVKRHMFLRHHPHENQAEAMLVQKLGEVRYNHVKEAEALAWIKTNPGWFLDLTVRRFAAFWYPPGPGGLNKYLRAITLLCFVGLALARKWPDAKLLVFVVLLIVYPLPHYVVQASERYRYPLHPVFLLFTGVVLFSIARRLVHLSGRRWRYSALSRDFQQTT